jgi:membrane protein
MLLAFNVSGQTIITLLKNIPFLDIVIEEQWLINNIITLSRPGLSGIITVLSIIWAGRLFAVSLQRGFKITFPGNKKRNPLTDTLVTFAIEFVALLLSLVLIFSSQVALYIYDFLDFLSGSSIIALASSKYFRGIFITAILWLVSFCAYLLIPANPPRRISALKGSVLYIIAYECTSKVLGFLFMQARINSLYGALGNIIVLMMNVYFFFLFFFIGAQFAFVTDSFEALLFTRMRQSRNKTAKNSRVSRLKLSANKLFSKTSGKLQKYRRFHRRGEIIFSQGDAGDEIFYMLEGKAEVLIASSPNDYPAETLIAGSFFGEMSYLLSEKRSATIRAKTDVSALALPPGVFEEVIKYDAGLNRMIIEHLTRRIKKGNDQIAALSAK